MPRKLPTALSQNGYGKFTYAKRSLHLTFLSNMEEDVVRWCPSCISKLQTERDLLAGVANHLPRAPNDNNHPQYRNVLASQPFLVPNPSCDGRRYRVMSSETVASKAFAVKRRRSSPTATGLGPGMLPSAPWHGGNASIHLCHAGGSPLMCCGRGPTVRLLAQKDSRES